eukprot:351937-Chlamydomonas_euryale.AAC.3
MHVQAHVRNDPCRRALAHMNACVHMATACAGAPHLSVLSTPTRHSSSSVRSGGGGGGSSP